MGKKLVVLDAKTLGDIDLDGFKHLGLEACIYPLTKPEETADRIADAQIVVSNKVQLKASNMGKDLQLICVAATGVNNVDLAAAAKKGVLVCNVPGYSSSSVVSHCFASYFHLAHHNLYHDQFTKTGGWSKSAMFTHLDAPYNELAGQVWGIIGLGAIGRAVAEVASAFGCKVVYHSPSGRNKEQPYEHLALNELLARADVISIHTPLNEHTQDLIGLKELREMRDTAFLLNMARGGIVVEAALATALDEDLIAGAALDVLSNEPPAFENPLFQINNKQKLFITPHIAGLSTQSRERLVAAVIENIKSYLEKGHPKTPCN